MSEKSEHPAPWTWRRNKHDGDQLVAANDLVVLECDDPWITVDAGPYARALIASAPEMEALLREEPTLDHVKEGDVEDDCDWDMCRHCGNEVDCDACPKDGPCWGAKVRALLARIDAAKAGE